MHSDQDLFPIENGQIHRPLLRSSTVQRPAQLYKRNNYNQDIEVIKTVEDQPLPSYYKVNHQVEQGGNNDNDYPSLNGFWNNQARSNRNAVTHISEQGSERKFYQQEQEKVDVENEYQVRASQKFPTVVTQSSSSKLSNVNAMNARLKLAEQQRLRQNQMKKKDDVIGLDQVLDGPEIAYLEPEDDFRMSRPPKMEYHYDPSFKGEGSGSLPQLTQETVTIKQNEQFNVVQQYRKAYQEEPGPQEEINRHQNKLVVRETPLEVYRQIPNQEFEAPENLMLNDIRSDKEFVREESKYNKEQRVENNKNVKEDKCKQEDLPPASGIAENPKIKILSINLKDVVDMKGFLMSPCPKGFRMQCSVKRDRSGLNRLYPKFHCLLSEGVQFMMTAKKRAVNRTSHYCIGFSSKECKKKSPYYLGKLRSNFMGTQFNVYNEGKNPRKTNDIELLRDNLAVVTYEANVISGKAAKKKVYVPEIDPSTGRACQFRPLNGVDDLLFHWKNGENVKIKELKKKEPTWSEEHQTYVSDFGGRAKKVSGKNFQLVETSDESHILLQFGKNTENTYILDFEWPFSPFQAFAICLTSFDYKIACE